VIRILSTFFWVFLFLSCQRNKDKTAATPVFTLTENTGINFVNSIQNTKDFNIFSYRNFYNGGGCAIGDINNDGLADVFFTANQGSNKLYINKGNFLFEDITAQSNTADSLSWSTGVALVDINADGWLDLYVCNAGYMNGQPPKSRMYINNHDLTFTDKAKEYNLENTGGYATHAAFFDYDNDNDLDCFIINNSFIPTNTLNYENKRNLRAKDWPVKDFLKGGGDRLMKNNNGIFEDVSEQAGVYGSLISFGLGVTVGDINLDGWQDVYVSNDFFERDYLYINQHNGTFKDELENYIQHTSHSSMGADMADVNNDGLPDIFTTEMLPDDDYRLKTTSSFENIDVNRQKIKAGFYYQYMQNTLQVNNGNGQFLETAFYSNVAASDWSWGGLIFDADNNSLPDIFVCNGIYRDVTDQDFIDFFADELYQKMALSGKKTDVDQMIDKMPSVPLANKMFVNKGGLHFKEQATQWGLATPSFSNGAAYGDLDNDGDLDLIVNNVNQPSFVYQNNSRQNTKDHFIAIALKGKAPNTFAIGSKVKIFTGNSIISRELIPTRGFQSSVDYKIIAGLGTFSSIDSVEIIWPDRTYNTFYKPKIDTLILYQQPASAPLYAFANTLTQPIFDTLKNSFDKHTEDDYIDFYTERNIPAMVSREGPKAAVADVNADGLDDVFIGGAANEAGKLYLQNKSGGFIKKETPVFVKDAAVETVCALFFDADKDGDMDLFVANGGNNQPANSDIYKNALYLNDGKGNFSEALTALPSNRVNSSCVAANDFDDDGDIDLFVGSRSIPGSYGETPNSSLLVNDGKGNFTDAAKTLYKNIANTGLITQAIWCNINGKNKKDLVLVGEWMAPLIFSFNGKEFVEQKTNLQQMYGLWQTVAYADVDNDGDDDLLLGNIGENFYLHPDENNPVKLWINDFDNNGTKDKILSKTVNGRDVPVFTKRELTDQMPSLKKQNLKHAEYAKKTVTDLFPSPIVDNAVIKKFNFASHCIALNNGQGNFSITTFPWQVQLSSMNAVLPADINNDGKMDLLIGSNKYDFLPQFCRLDAAFGIALLNDGKGKFNYLENKQSGITIKGCVRDIKPVNTKAGINYLWLRNNDDPVLMKQQKK
jgi:hypothetical protein